MSFCLSFRLASFFVSILHLKCGANDSAAHAKAKSDLMLLIFALNFLMLFKSSIELYKQRYCDTFEILEHETGSTGCSSARAHTHQKRSKNEAGKECEQYTSFYTKRAKMLYE